MRKWLFFLVFCSLLLAACSNEDEFVESKQNMDSAKGEVSRENEMQNSVSLQDDHSGEVDKVDSPEQNGEPTEQANEISQQRMVIYHAELSLLVKNFSKARNGLEKKAIDYGGYMIESNSYRKGEAEQSGTMTFRIPQEKFQSFLNDAEGLAVQVNSREVNGQDVTEEFVDLESRLKSKKVVESRLLDFMKSAQKTEDLLKISSDLASIQEEIEQLAGKIKYLKNQTALSTVTIFLEESGVKIPKIQNEQLDTWHKIKKQFADNINFLLSFGSGLMIFLFGNLPIILLIAVGLTVFMYVIRRKKVKKNNTQDSNP